ncbi:transposase family protein, partial [Streptomyces sp. TX20-6-3]|uniref:transposase family protein n=1 Tax=Streptomyces sp. TX20-6-3 TaxID=3028705 RepID=UPI0029A12F06
MLVHPSGVDVSSSALRFLTRQLRRHRRPIGSRWRRLSAGRRALRTLAHLRVGHTYARLAAGFKVGTTTAYRHVTEAVDLPAALAPARTDAVRTASAKAYFLLDGTLLPIDRIAADRPFSSGKHKKHGMNVQVMADPSAGCCGHHRPLPGAVHDVRAAREHGIVDALAEAGIRCWADKGYRDAGGTVRIPYWGRWATLSAGQQTVNRSHARI